MKCPACGKVMVLNGVGTRTSSAPGEELFWCCYWCGLFIKAAEVMWA